jgi:hypothetical protein
MVRKHAIKEKVAAWRPGYFSAVRAGLLTLALFWLPV